MFKNKDASRDIEEVEQIKNNPYGYYGYYEKDKKYDVKKSFLVYSLINFLNLYIRSPLLLRFHVWIKLLRHSTCHSSATLWHLLTYFFHDWINLSSLFIYFSFHFMLMFLNTYCV